MSRLTISETNESMKIIIPPPGFKNSLFFLFSVIDIIISIPIIYEYPKLFILTDETEYNLVEITGFRFTNEKIIQLGTEISSYIQKELIVI